MTELRGEPTGHGRRVAVVAARFNGQITDKLVAGATAGLARHGVAEGDVDVVWVPGAFEIPLVAGRLATGGTWIDRSRPVAFTFDGRPLEGFAGDTVASALLAKA